MSDGSKRVVSFAGSYPLGTLEVVGDDGFQFACVASPGVREEQPAEVPFRFSNSAPDAPDGYDTLTAELVFTSYLYDPEEALASWTADMYISGVIQDETIVNGDTDVPVAGEPIAVEGDVQIFGDSNCLTYPSGEISIAYARINTPWGFDGGWESRDGLLTCYAPASPAPNDPYSVIWDYDFYSADRTTPFTNGQVVEIHSSDALNVEGVPVVFTRP